MADEVDQSLVHALQLAPRASWEYLGPLLDVDPVTLARRWKRLRERGAARVTAVLPAAAAHDFVMAFVELDCAPARTVDIGRLLAEEPRVQTIYACTGQYHLYVTVYTTGLDDLGYYLTERIARIDGVRAMRTHVVTDLLLPGATWELRALSPAQRTRLLTDHAPANAAGRQGVLAAEDQRIFDELVRDGRVSYRELGQRLEVSASTARRRLNVLLAARAVVPRCDIAQRAFGWSASVVLWASGGRDGAAPVGRIRREVPEVRLLGAVSGTRNLAFVLWLRQLADLEAVERRLTDLLPDLVVDERTVLLETMKLAGHMLDRAGRPWGVVPTNVWSSLPDDR